jgi:hypothetical protein
MENVMAKGIRSYGPGKFNTVIDGYAYEMTLDGGADAEASYGEGNGWYGFMEVDQAFADRIHEIAKEQKDRLTDEEQDLLDESEAIILFERSDGGVDVDWYDDPKEAAKAWAAIEADVEDVEDEDDEEDPDDEETDDAFSDEEMAEGYVISDGRNGGYDVVHEHKHFEHYRSIENALEEIALSMEQNKVYTNIYYVNDHGNVDLIDANGKIIESRV